MVNNYIIILITIFLPAGASCFEIKPISIMGGAYSRSVNTSNLIYEEDNYDCLNEKEYMLKGRNQPVHEAITRMAYKNVFKKELVTENFKDALISGVEWNDDPEQLLKKMVLNNGIDNIKEFVRRIKDVDGKSLTSRSHNGDLQFLHAMTPLSAHEHSPEKVKRMIYDWIKESYRVVTGEIKHDTKISKTYFKKYFSAKYEYVYQIFDPQKLLYSENSYPKTIQRLASGSILHIIQDTYCNSHAKRVKSKLTDFHSYPNENHCVHDAAQQQNKLSINMAIDASVKYLKLRKDNATWCNGVSDYIKQVLSFEIQNDC